MFKELFCNPNILRLDFFAIYNKKCRNCHTVLKSLHIVFITQPQLISIAFSFCHYQLAGAIDNLPTAAR